MVLQPKTRNCRAAPARRIRRRSAGSNWIGNWAVRAPVLQELQATSGVSVSFRKRLQLVATLSVLPSEYILYHTTDNRWAMMQIPRGSSDNNKNVIIN